jgi:hypothetical protein
VNRYCLIILLMFVRVIPGAGQAADSAKPAPIYGPVIPWTEYGAFQEFSKADSVIPGSLNLRLRSTGFFKNNEYQNDFITGYTLVGINFEPVLEYHADRKATFRGGAHLLKYSGRDEFDRILPVLSLQYDRSDHFSLIVGTLYGTAAHGLPEPVFDFENYLINNYENGLQMLFKYPGARGDVWLNWEKFLKKGDPFQEKFTMGINTLFRLAGTSHFQLTAPFSAIFRHQGGEIDDTNLPASTRLNLSEGLRAELLFGEGFFKSMWVSHLYFQFQEINPGWQVAVPYGSASYSRMGLETKIGSLESGYWSSHDFISPHGMPLFQSVSTEDPGFFLSYREMLVVKYQYQANLTDYLRLAIRIEPYYLFDTRRIDHSWSVYLIMDEGLFLARTNHKRGE